MRGSTPLSRAVGCQGRGGSRAGYMALGHRDLGPSCPPCRAMLPPCSALQRRGATALRRGVPAAPPPLLPHSARQHQHQLRAARGPLQRGGVGLHAWHSGQSSVVGGPRLCQCRPGPSLPKPPAQDTGSNTPLPGPWELTGQDWASPHTAEQSMFAPLGAEPSSCQGKPPQGWHWQRGWARLPRLHGQRLVAPSHPAAQPGEPPPTAGHRDGACLEGTRSAHS